MTKPKTVKQVQQWDRVLASQRTEATLKEISRLLHNVVIRDRRSFTMSECQRLMESMGIALAHEKAMTLQGKLSKGGHRAKLLHEMFGTWFEKARAAEQARIAGIKVEIEEGMLRIREREMAIKELQEKRKTEEHRIRMKIARAEVKAIESATTE